MEICKICQKEYKRLASLGIHIAGTHKMSTEQYYVDHISTENMTCACGKPTKYLSLKKGFSHHCSAKCAYHDTLVTKKREDTNIKRYGSKRAMDNDAIKNKAKETLYKNYGVYVSFKSPELKNKSVETILKKYGVDNVLKSDVIKSKIKDTMIRKYGVEHPTQNTDILKKQRATCLKNHGVEYPMQSKDVQAKVAITNLDRYGCKAPTQSSDVMDKVRSTNRERYGVDYVMQNADIKEKAKETNIITYGVEYPSQSANILETRRLNTLKKYGVEHTTQLSDMKQKTIATFRSKYGVDNIQSLDSIKQKVKNTNLALYGMAYAFLDPNVRGRVNMHRIEELDRKYVDMLIPHSCKYIRYTDEQMLEYTCDICGAKNTESPQFVYKCRCKRGITPCVGCKPKDVKVSFLEKEVFEFIKQYADDAIENDRTIISPYELDVYIPSKSLAFEFNGLYYHSEISKPTNYHLNKTNQCADLGIQLIHIYEDDWLYRPEIVKSRIMAILGKTETIYARKCEVKPVSAKDTETFLIDNHIQGSCPSHHRFGLYYENKLVSLMTFGKSRFESDMYELLRYCNILNTRVVGGASRLFKYALQQTKLNQIVSYADRSWSVGDLYNKLGFDLVGITKPNYSYVVVDQRESRMKYQKHKLVAAGFDANKTEHEIMLDRELYRIYDSGNLKYLYTTKSP